MITDPSAKQPALTTSPVRGPEQRHQGAAGRRADGGGEPLGHAGKTGGPLQLHPAVLGRLRDHDSLGQVAGASHRADQRDQGQQERKGQQLQGMEQRNRGGSGCAGQIRGPGNGPRADPVHQRPGERFDHHVGGHLAEGHQSGLGGTAGRDKNEPGQCHGRDPSTGQRYGHGRQHPAQRPYGPPPGYAVGLQDILRHDVSVTVAS